MSDRSFYRGKRVFLTGHTGFKGSWLSLLLLEAGAELTGYALAPQDEPNLFSLLNLGKQMHSILGDVRDFAALKRAFDEARPEIMLHLAAQPLVRESYRAPVETFDTNVMGTVNLLECVRQSTCVKSLVNVTTDKVYRNNETNDAFREGDPLGGYDPYSSSKACSEIVTESYQNSFLRASGVAVSTARAGNVIGVGDFARDRILPDCIRAAYKGEPIVVRNPASIRPYQHVLDPLDAYLQIARRQYEDASLADHYNIGPDVEDCVTTGALTTLFCDAWGEGQRWEHRPDGGPHEATFLRLDCEKIAEYLGITPRWHIADAVSKTVEWAKAYRNGADLRACMLEQIRAFDRA